MKIVISTQCYENYAWTEQGELLTGDQAYWKAKFGNDYVIENVPVDFAANGNVEAYVQSFAKREEIEQFNDAWREYIVSWSIEEDDYLTWFEKSQLEYEGKIDHPAHRWDFVTGARSV